MEAITIYTDGGARGNPGPAGVGAVILDGEGKVLKEISDYIGETTNNVAEYEALIRALTAVVELFGEKLRSMKIEVCMDSELAVRQLNGIYKVKDATLKKLFARVATVRLEHMPNVIFTHVGREKNTHADTLVNAAIDGHH